jgi:protein phosphatase/serine/threonine-protein phosphatase Stp1
MSEPSVVSWGITHPGAKRPSNQDSFVNRPDIGLWAVADGAGGHQGGELASGMLREALEAVPPSLSATDLIAHVRAAISSTHDALRRIAGQQGPSVMMASTIVVLIVRDGYYACLWAGDSRSYLLRNGEMEQLTHDHSLVQELVDSGTISRKDAETHPHGNVITRAVGADNEVVLEKTTDSILPGDRFLLCSDGLHKTLSEDAIARILSADAGVSPTEALIAAALALSASDNVTAVVVEIPGAPAA